MTPMYRLIDYLMKKSRIALASLLLIVGGLIVCAVLHPFGNNKPTKRQAILHLMMMGLEAEHYNPLPINDSLSARVYNLYLKRLDYYKQYLTQKDIDELEPYKYKIDDEIKAGTFEFFDKINSIIDTRIGQDSTDIKKILSSPFDFNKDETFETDPSKLTYVKNAKELHERRVKTLKYQVMLRLAEMIAVQDTAQAKKDTSVKIKPFAELEKEARQKELKTYRNLFRDYKEATDNDKVTEYLNTIANCFDPHTEYFAPQEKKDFDIQMSGQLEGIGAQLQDKNGNITVVKVIPGSPTWKNGEIKEGDVILKVAQDTGEAVDIEGMRLDKAVQLIRGKKGTKVKLTIRKVNNTVKTVTLVRDVIQIQETFAKDAIIEQGKKIGYIRLPEFYTPFETGGTRTCWSDVKKQLIELNNEGVQGIIMDLRSNGGGSLQDVVKMVGLLIPQGPIVQIKNTGRPAASMNDNDTSVFYRGPFIVLVNGYSASASEIFAAAIQDYKRGVIMGSNTYGKGTVQQIFNLDQYAPPDDRSFGPLGAVKITISKFYRINGGSTQLDGVTPDIPVPDADEYLYEKEKASDYPIKWDKIPPADYQAWNNPPNFDKLRTDAENDMSADTAIQLIKQESLQFKMQKDSSVYPLNLKAYQAMQRKLLDENKKFKAISKAIPEMKIIATEAEKAKMSSDTNAAKSDNTWFRQLTKDPELYEATRVIDNMN